MAHIFIGIPTYERWMHIKLFETLIQPSTKHKTRLAFTGTSFATQGFNDLWCRALNGRKEIGVTHFLMVHTDIAPEVGFVDKMVAIMERVGADLLSVHSPLKNEEGLTSTALETANPWAPKRFTMKELAALPRTFTHPDLLLNNGCMLVDLSKPWVDEVMFNQEIGLAVDERGMRSPLGFPEDWYFSRVAKAKGAKIYGTGEVSLMHFGDAPFGNDCVWGTQETDVHSTAPLKSPGIAVTGA